MAWVLSMAQPETMTEPEENAAPEAGESITTVGVWETTLKLFVVADCRPGDDAVKV